MLVLPIEQYIAKESNILYATLPRRIIAKDDNGGDSVALSTSVAIREWSTKVTFDVYSYNSPIINFVYRFSKN